VSYPAVAGAPAPPATSAGPAQERREEPESGGHLVKAPMVGIFYQSSAPGKPPFVEIGQAVRKGDVLCIIEAMKLMNQIETDVSGVVARILVENGDPVEYGQPLFEIREG
jgi:acetyl-CoA carboxylase biotin carboxyl carrier protein